MHHIIPRYLGGTDDPSNLIKLSIEEHAAAHKKLYEEHGHIEDHIAYLGLSKLVESGEAAQLAMKEGQRKGGRKAGLLKKDPIKQSEKIRNMWKIPGMRDHLVEKRKEQSRLGNNPMQGKQQRKACCLKCRQIISVNGLSLHQRKCY